VIVINLLPKEERTEEHVFTGRPRAAFLLPLLAVLVLGVPLVGSYAMQQMKIKTLEREMQIVEQEAHNLKPRLDLIDRIGAQQAALNRQLSLVGTLNRDRVHPVRMLDELVAQVPDQLWLTRVEQRGPATLLMEGMAFSNLMVADLMTRLEASELFAQVDLAITERRIEQDTKVVKFTVTTGLMRP